MTGAPAQRNNPLLQPYEAQTMTTDHAAAKQDRLIRLIGFLSHDPSNPMLLADAMSLAIETGDLANGTRLIEHIRQHAIDDPQTCALALHLSLQARDFATAAGYGDKALEGGIDHPAVIFNTALAHFHSGDPETTARLFALHGADQSNTPALVLHARALYHQELTEKAEPLVVQAVSQSPEDLEARGLLALLRYENDDLEGALSLSRQVLIADPNQLDALVACASAHFDQRSFAASRSTWLHTVEAHPHCGRAWFGLGQLEFNALEFDQAREHLNNAVEFMPDHIGTWHLLAWIYILREDSANARDALLKAYELDRSFGETHGGLAVVDIMDGLEDEGRFGIRRALKLNPDSLSARYAEMLLLRRAGKTEEAAQLVDQVLDRTSPDGHTTGRVLMQRWQQDVLGNAQKTPSDPH